MWQADIQARCAHVGTGGRVDFATVSLSVYIGLWSAELGDNAMSAPDKTLCNAVEFAARLIREGNTVAKSLNVSSRYYGFEPAEITKALKQRAKDKKLDVFDIPALLEWIGLSVSDVQQFYEPSEIVVEQYVVTEDFDFQYVDMMLTTIIYQLKQ